MSDYLRHLVLPTGLYIIHFIGFCYLNLSQSGRYADTSRHTFQLTQAPYLVLNARV